MVFFNRYHIFITMPRWAFTAVFVMIVFASFALKVVETPTAQLKLIYHVLNTDSSIKHGEYQQFFELKLRVKGNYQNNLKHGKWTRYYADGKPQIEAEYQKGLKVGKWMYYYPDGALKAIAYFNNNLKTGTWQGFTPDGEKISVVNYQADTLFGEQVYYHDNGEIAVYKEIDNTNGQKVTKISHYYDNNKIYESYTLVNNKMDGRYKKFHPTGIIWEEFTFNKGRLLKVHRMENPTGTKLYLGNFKEGEGELKRYHFNGMLYAEENYMNGYLSGKAKYFFNGILRCEGFYSNNIPVGTWKYFSEYSKLLEERVYLNSENLYYTTFFGIGNAERTEGEVKNGHKTGTWKKYNYYGDLESETSYSLGELHGQYKRFDGNLVLEKGGYFYGEKVGRWQTFNKSQKVVFEDIYSKSVSFDTLGVRPEIKPLKIDPTSGFYFSKSVAPPTFCSVNLTEDGYLNQYLNYPETAQQLNVRGKVVVYLFIDEFGDIEKIKLQKGIGFGCDKEVIRILNLLPNYDPSFNHGIPQQFQRIKEFTFGERF